MALYVGNGEIRRENIASKEYKVDDVRFILPEAVYTRNRRNNFPFSYINCKVTGVEAIYTSIHEEAFLRLYLKEIHTTQVW